MVREVHRAGESLRVWTSANGPLDEVAEGLTVEWAGQVGHPSSYGLLGGRSSQVTQVAPGDARGYEESLAGAADQVRFGLPSEYAAAVSDALTTPVEVTIAAHGLVGSSPAVFSRVAAFLALLLRDGVPEDDEDLWSGWAKASRSQEALRPLRRAHGRGNSAVA
jgi:hypothetical protein